MNAHGSTDETAIKQAFEPYLDDCDSYSSSPATTTIPTSYLTWYGTFIPTTMSGIAINGSAPVTTVVYQSVNVTSTLPAYSFHLNVSSLISKFVPTDVFSQLAASVASVASAASITGAEDPTSLIYSALEDTSIPTWFQSAVPVTYSTQMATLEAQINNLRADSLGSTAPLSPQSAPTTVAPTSSVPNGTTSCKWHSRYIG